jgi:hypothetical protein
MAKSIAPRIFRASASSSAAMAPIKRRVRANHVRLIRG